MKIIHFIINGNTPTLADIHDAVGRFYGQYKVKPTCVKMSSYDMLDFMKYLSCPTLLTLEQDKKYANYVQTVTGPVMLDVCDMDEDLNISVSYTPGLTTPKFIIVENAEIDEAFEKHVLNEGK